MEVAFKTGALADIEFWKRSGNKLIQKKIQDYSTQLHKLRKMV